MKERSYRFEEEPHNSSQGSSSFSMEYPNMKPMPSFSKLQEQRISPSLRTDNSRRVNISRKEIQGLFTSDTIIKRPERSHLGFVATPEKYEHSQINHLGVNSVLYSPREVMSSHSPKPSVGCEREVYERRIKQMTKDWAVQKASLKKQIKQLEFIVQQWQLLDDRKMNSGISKSSEMMLLDVGSPRQSLELTRLKRQLQDCEAEKQEMFKDFVELEKELKKVKLIGNFDQSAISDVKQLEFSNHSNDSLRHSNELEAMRNDYERLLLEKDGRYQELLADFTELQEELEKQRTQTMILLQKRTNELESNLTTLKVANDEINSELRSAIDRANNELQEEKAKYRKLENELSYKDHGVKVLEHELEASRKDLEELRQIFMNKCVEFEVAKLQPTKQAPKNKQENSTQTVRQQFRDNHCQAEESAAARLSAVNATLHYREENEKLTRRRDQLEQALVERQNSFAMLLHAKNELGLSFSRLEANHNALLKEKGRLESELQREISSRQSLELRNSRTVETNRDQQLTDLKVERSLNKKEIESLRLELQQSRRKVDSYRNEQQYEKIQLNSQDRVTRNNYEVTIHNLTGQLESAKIKFEGVEARLELKKRQLKEKDDFIRNTIVTRVGKVSSESEIEFLLRKVDEFLEACSKRENVP